MKALSCHLDTGLLMKCLLSCMVIGGRQLRLCDFTYWKNTFQYTCISWYGAFHINVDMYLSLILSSSHEMQFTVAFFLLLLSENWNTRANGRRLFFKEQWVFYLAQGREKDILHRSFNWCSPRTLCRIREKVEQTQIKTSILPRHRNCAAVSPQLENQVTKLSSFPCLP